MAAITGNRGLREFNKLRVIKSSKYYKGIQATIVDKTVETFDQISTNVSTTYSLFVQPPLPHFNVVAL